MTSDAVITLPDARIRVAEAMRIETAPWTEDDIRWLIDEWAWFSGDVRRLHDLDADLTAYALDQLPVGFVIYDHLANGVRWWIVEAPPSARYLAGLAFLWMAGFSWGLL